jgi:hypothetical protein
MKICTKCKSQKEKERFRSKKESKDGLRPWCRECESQHRKANREKENKRYAEWTMKNSEHVRIKASEYRKNNKVKVNEYKKKWRYENKDAVNNSRKKWINNNREKKKVIDKKASEVMSDFYISNMIVKYTKMDRKDVPKELIELKRLQLKITRELRSKICQ